MISLSSRAHYAVSALSYLAEQHPSGRLVKSAEIARTQSIPQSYLEQLMSRLCKANLIMSHRGAKGGYKLARKPDAITVREVIEIVDGPIKLRPGERSGLSPAWRVLGDRLAGVLQVTLPELAELAAQKTRTGSS